MKMIIARVEAIAPLADYEEILERHMEKDKANQACNAAIQ